MALHNDKLDHPVDSFLDDHPYSPPVSDPVPETFENTQEERELVRKLDKRILPITCLLYLFACPFISFICGFLLIPASFKISTDRT